MHPWLESWKPLVGAVRQKAANLRRTSLDKADYKEQIELRRKAAKLEEEAAEWENTGLPPPYAVLRILVSLVIFGAWVAWLFD